MLENKEARQRTYAMFTAKFITLQEVQKTVTRSHYLWTVRVRRLSFLSTPLVRPVLSGSIRARCWRGAGGKTVVFCTRAESSARPAHVCLFAVSTLCLNRSRCLSSDVW